MSAAADWGTPVPYEPAEWAEGNSGRHYRPDFITVVPGLDSDALLEIVYQGEKLKLAREIYGEDTIFPQHRPEGAGRKIRLRELVGGDR